MIAKRSSLILAPAVVLILLLAACQQNELVVTRIVESEVEVTRITTETVVEEGEPVEVTRIVTEEIVKEVPAVVEKEVPPAPITLQGWNTDDVLTLDPQMAGTGPAINNIENLFVNLTNYDLNTSEVVPETATTWEISDDGLTFTFHLRTDIPWVKHNPVTGETTQEIEFDEDGNEIGPRFVTAHDFVYGIKRACDPNSASYYSGIVAPLISGCADVLEYEGPEAIPDELWDGIGVTAPDDSTLVVELEFPASYFLSMTPMWTLAATPQWAIEEHGDDWTEAGRIVTNGRYVLDEWVHDVRSTLVRNPLMPKDMQGEGNVEVVQTSVVPNSNTGYTLWLNNEVDQSLIPGPELQAHLEQFPDETTREPTLIVLYLPIRTKKPPFDDPAVRRAFSAAVDRDTYVREIVQGQGQPMIHFAPPGIFGAPPIDEVGIDYDPDFARAQLAEAGYPNCEGFPRIHLLVWQDMLTILEFMQAQWQEVLGCPADLIQIQELPWMELLAATAHDVSDEDAPHMWTAGWGPDYPDENNWVGDVLWCGNPYSDLNRECSEVDDLIVEAREEPDPARRIELYRRIEEMFFGREGEVPIIPIFLNIIFVAEHSWLDETQSLFGGQQYYNWTIDQEAKLAAQGE